MTTKIGHDFNTTLGTGPVEVVVADARNDLLELENRSASSTLLFYWQGSDEEGDPPSDPDAWHSVSPKGARLSPCRTNSLWLRALSGTVHYVLTVG